jgi:UDP-glucose-4-epimerase GalE
MTALVLACTAAGRKRARRAGGAFDPRAACATVRVPMEALPRPEPPEDGSDPAAARGPRPLPVPAGPVLVTGGAGYIGACCVRVLERLGVPVVVLDNLSTGHRASVRGTFEHVDLGDRDALARVFATHEPVAVVHFAARCYVGESVTEPATYYRENVIHTWNLLEAMRAHGCRDIVFSSTCATYGEPRSVPIPVDHPQNPINPYGRTKLHMEHMLQDYSRAYGLRTAALRYFNAAGAMPEEGLGEDHDPETHIIPLVLQVALGQRRAISVFGGDWPTRDGTCVRDYVHVEDLADAHVRALVKLQDGATAIATNLGTGRGYTVKDLIVLARRVTGKEIAAEVVGRRPGDPAQLVADGAHAREVLGWIPRRSSLEQILRDAWAYASKDGATLAPGARAAEPAG